MSEREVAPAEPEVTSMSHHRVDMNQEIANLLRYQILCNAFSRQISGYYGSLQYVVDNMGG